jgi:hypothetical protein
MWSRAVVAVGCGLGALAVLSGLTGCAAKKKRRARVVYSVPRAPDLPRAEVMALAERAWQCGRASGEFSSSLLTVIDYSLPSTEPRLWVIDMVHRRVLHHELVAHGEGSGDNLAVAFSNRMGSHQSSLGLFRTEDTYVGGQGYSLRLEGLEPGVNDRAMERRIVMHGADYVDSALIPGLGRLGRSHGCPALSRRSASTIIDRIKWGSALFAYYPDPEWLAYSHYLRCDGGVQTARVP